VAARGPQRRAAPGVERGLPVERRQPPPGEAQVAPADGVGLARLQAPPVEPRRRAPMADVEGQAELEVRKCARRVAAEQEQPADGELEERAAEAGWAARALRRLAAQSVQPAARGAAFGSASRRPEYSPRTPWPTPSDRQRPREQSISPVSSATTRR
jgi:hypothetical protein